MKMNRKRRLKIENINPHLICVLCGGYFIDATTIIECLHSFCRACIVQYLQTNRFCPICDVQVHKSKPLQNIRPDHTLQNLVYKLVPGLYQSEMRAQREFQEKFPESVPREDISNEMCIFTPDECFSLILEYYEEPEQHLQSLTPVKQEKTISSDNDPRVQEDRGDSRVCEKQDGNLSIVPGNQLLRDVNATELSLQDKGANSYLNKNVPCENQPDSTCSVKNPLKQGEDEGDSCKSPRKQLCINTVDCAIKKRFYRCPAAVTVTHLQKLIRAKYNLNVDHPVEVLYRDEILSNHLTLIDVAYIYNWKRKGPLKLHFRIFQPVPAENCKKEVLSIEPNVGKDSQDDFKGISEKVETSSNWKEVQLQISETGIMSVAGISLEHNNNLTSTNNNLLDNASALDSITLEHANSQTKKEELLSIVVGKEKKSDDSKKQTIPSPVGKNLEENSHSSQAKQLNVAVNKKGDQTTEGCDGSPNNQVLNRIDVKSDVNNKNVINVSVDNKVNNVGSEKRKCATPMKIPDTCANVAKKARLAPVKPCESLDLSLKLMKKDEVVLIAERSNNNEAKSVHKSNTKLATPIVSVRMDDDNRRTHLTEHDASFKEKNSLNAHVSVSITPSAQIKKSPNSSAVGYKTLKVPPKTWNPSITRSSYLNSKSCSDGNTNSNSTSCPSKTPEKVPKFFKMRNMPRYLGNPASGVKPMYQVAGDSKTQESSEPSGKSKQVVMKIDPKTLCPIAAPTTSTTSVPPGKPLYTTPSGLDIIPTLAEAPKTSPRNKSHSPSGKSQALVSSPSAKNTSPPVSYSYAARTSSPFANPSLPSSGHTNSALSSAALSVRSPPATTSNNVLLNPANYSINPATLNLLSSNLSFLPNASSFLYGNYRNFAPPLIRPNLNIAAPGSGLPSALTAFHAMPPSINMLFSHHRSNSGSGFPSPANRPQTPAVQRIPASKGNGNSSNSGFKSSKACNVPNSKNNQAAVVQKPVNSHAVVKATSSANLSNIDDKGLRDGTLVQKKNSLHVDEVNSTIESNVGSNVNSSNNNNTNISTSKTLKSSDLVSVDKSEVNPPSVDAPAPVTVIDKCVVTKEADPATDLAVQTEPPTVLQKEEVIKASDKKVLSSSEQALQDTSESKSDTGKREELVHTNCEKDCNQEKTRGAITDSSRNSDSGTTIDGIDKVVN